MRQLIDAEVPESKKWQQKIIALAAKIIIKDEVKSIPVNQEQYPSIDELNSLEKVSHQVKCSE